MKKVELCGVIAKDVSALWIDLLQKSFDVEAVGVSSEATFVYMADDEEKDPRPIIEGWAGKEIAKTSRSQEDARQKEIAKCLEEVKKRRAEKAAALAAEKAELAERKNLGYPELKVSSTGNPGMFGIVEALANDIDSHTVLIQKVDPAGAVMDGSEKLSISTSHKVAISDDAPKLSEGMAMVQIGPSTHIGDFTVEVTDRSGGMKPVKLQLRFVKQHSESLDQDQYPAPVLEKKGGIMSAIRKVFGV